MTFDDVEKARLAYLEKVGSLKRKDFKKVQWAGVICLVIVLVLFVIILAFSFIFPGVGNSAKDSRFVVFDALRIIVPVLFFVVIWVVGMASVFAFMHVKSNSREDFDNYKKAYKGYFIEKELAKVFTDIRYNHAAGLDKSILLSTGMINTGDSYSSNDLTIGKYKNVDFMQADVMVQEEHKDKDGKKVCYTIFRGRFMIFEFPKKFQSRMMLTHYGLPYRKTSEVSGKELNFMETESIDFNKAFAVYAEDGLEAFYILTPDFMENVQELGRLHHDMVSIYFADNKMIIGINDGDDIFEPPNPKLPLNEKAETAKVNGEINLVTNIVDKLKLDRNSKVIL